MNINLILLNTVVLGLSTWGLFLNGLIALAYLFAAFCGITVYKLNVDMYSSNSNNSTEEVG